MPRTRKTVAVPVGETGTTANVKPVAVAKAAPHWMKLVSGGTACSECGAMLNLDGQINLDCSSFKFCFGCGAPMGGDAGATT